MVAVKVNKCSYFFCNLSCTLCSGVISFGDNSLIFQHQYHTKIDDIIEKTNANMVQGLIGKLMSVLEATLSKLSRYDEGSLIGSILSFTVCIFCSLIC